MRTIFLERRPPSSRWGYTARMPHRLLGAAYFILVPLGALLTAEWIQRGGFGTFFPSLSNPTYSYLLAWVFLEAI